MAISTRIKDLRMPPLDDAQLSHFGYLKNFDVDGEWEKCPVCKKWYAPKGAVCSFCYEKMVKDGRGSEL